MATPITNHIQKHLAVLIDADNAPAAIVEGLFEEIAKYGVASVKRIYGDWTVVVFGVYGWVITLFNDCDSLDYCAAPDGRSGSFESWSRFGTDPVSSLSV
ncbi:MAG: DUF7693 family protein [Pseudomonas sp.]